MAKYFPRNNLCVYISRPIRFPILAYDDHCDDGDGDNDASDKLSYFRIAQATKPRIAEREKNVTTFSFKYHFS